MSPFVYISSQSITYSLEIFLLLLFLAFIYEIHKGKISRMIKKRIIDLSAKEEEFFKSIV